MSTTPLTHHHHHQHHHPPSHQHDSVANANRDYFNQHLHDFDAWPQLKERAERVAKTIRQSYALDKEETVAMEFACGNGVVSNELLPHVKSVLGVDISQRMVDLFNAKFEGNDNASAVCVELKGVEGELSDARFDLIFCSSAYHHFESIENITAILAFFLKPGGALIVVDMIQLAEGYAFEEDQKAMVPHKHGLGKEDIQRAFDTAGLSLKTFEDVPSGCNDQDLFLAIGEKPSV